VCAWIKPTSFAGSGEYRGLVAKWEVNKWTYYLGFDEGAGSITGIGSANPIFGTADGAGGTQHYCWSFNTLSTGQWCHVCGRRTGTGASTQRMFLNGSIDGSAVTTSVSMVTSTARLGIGAFGHDVGVQGYFDGRIARVGIWNVALTDGEIAALARGVSPRKIRNDGTTSSALRGYWPMQGWYRWIRGRRIRLARF
jgi:hypothetical protein